MTPISANLGYIPVSIDDGNNHTGLNSPLLQNIKTVANSNQSICTQVIRGAKYAFTAGVGILAVASVTYAATHGFFSIDLGTQRGHSGAMEAKGMLGKLIINQLNEQGKTPDQIPRSFWAG